MLSIPRLGLVIGLLSGRLAVLPGLPGLAAAPAGAASAARVIPAPARPVGYSGHVAAQPDPARYVSLIEGGGADSLRDDVQWAYVEPARGHFSWSTPDKIVAQAARHRLHPLLIVDTSPPWASGGKTTNPIWFWLPPRNPAAYGAFAARVAAR